MPILLTGADGFIGSHIATMLSSNGYTWRAFEGDIVDATNVERNLRDVETVIHTAGITYAPLFFDYPYETMSVNVGGTLNLLRCHKFFERLIFFSTSHIYGKQDEFPIRETATPHPVDTYSAGKIMCEQSISAYRSAYRDFHYVILRPFNNFGPNQNYKFVVPTLIKQAFEGTITIRGNTERELVYVKNTVDAVRTLLEHPDVNEETLNVAIDDSRSIYEIADLIRGFVGSKEPICVQEQTPREADIPKLRGSYDHIRQVLGWTPKYSLEEGLRATVQHYGERWGYLPRVLEDGDEEIVEEESKAKPPSDKPEPAVHKEPIRVKLGVETMVSRPSKGSP